MNNVEIKKRLFAFLWVALTACIAVFFIVALCVYTKAPPSGVSDLLSRDDSWLSSTELSSMSGDLEEYSYVTKVYEYSTDGEDIDICWINDEHVTRTSIIHGIVTDENAERNYRVECFVYSDIADKRLIKRTWSDSVTENGDVLTFAESKAPYCNWDSLESGDIRKESYNKGHNYNLLTYTVFFRITVRPGFNDVNVEVKDPNAYY